jgi:preprotein translocase subunit SecE
LSECLRKGTAMIQRIRNFFREVKVEAAKVNYPSKDDLIGSTWVVIVTVLVISVFLGMIDFSLGKLVNYIILR